MGSEWETVTLGQITKWQSGGTPKKSEDSYWNGDIPWISASSMDGNFYSDSKHRITKAGLENGSKLAPANSILLLVRGSILHQKIQVGMATGDVAFNQDVKCLIPDKKIDPWYLLIWFKAKESELLNLVENTGIGAGKLDTKLLQDLPVSLPPLSERQRITEFGRALFEKITLNREINQTLEQMAQALFKSWFVDFDPVIDNALAAGNPIPDELQPRAEQRKALQLKASGENDSEGCYKPLPESVRALFPDAFEESELGWVPKGWGLKAVSDAITVNPKVKLSKGTVAKFVDMKALPTSGYSIEEVSEKAYSGGAKFEKNDVLLARITPCLQNGKTGYVDFLDDEAVGFGSTEFIVLRGNERLDSTYVACLARDESFRLHAMQSMVGSSGRQRVQNSCFDSYYVSEPTENVMKAFVDFTKPAFAKFKVNANESLSLTNLRDTLLPKLISGELQLDQLPDAVASVA